MSDIVGSFHQLGKGAVRWARHDLRIIPMQVNLMAVLDSPAAPSTYRVPDRSRVVAL